MTVKKTHEADVKPNGIWVPKVWLLGCVGTVLSVVGGLAWSMNAQVTKQETRIESLERAATSIDTLRQTQVEQGVILSTIKDLSGQVGRLEIQIARFEEQLKFLARDAPPKVAPKN